MSDHDHYQDPAAEYAFCPRCATPLADRRVGDKVRRSCPACGFIYFPDPKVGVGVLVIEDGKILLVRRAMSPARGKWSIPAGFLDQGEDPQATAIREAWEETNLQVTISGLVDVYFNPPAGRGASLFILYRAQVEGGELKAGDDADDAGFFGPDELPELAFTSTFSAVEMLKEALATS